LIPVREVDGTNAGFAMVNVERQNHWAPSVAPVHEREGGGGDLHDAMPERFFRRLDAPRSNTGPATRAERSHPRPAVEVVRSEPGNAIMGSHR